MRIALFVTCLADTLFPQAPRAVVEVLERLGHEVAFPEEQTCCGQMHFNSGYSEEGLALARRFERVFADADVVVSPSASCVGMVREHCSPELASRVFELAEFLVKRLGLEDVGAYYPHRVTYHPTCHSLRMLRVGDKPLQLLRAVRGLDLVELPDAEVCCGFGGTFAAKFPMISTAMGEVKCASAFETGAEYIVSNDSRQLVPHAHRRRPGAPARGRSHRASR